MYKSIRSLAAGVLLALAGLSAQAATITRTYTFTMSDFTGFYANPAPYNPVSGSFTVTFDPNVAVYNKTDGLMVHSLNLPVAGPLAFSFTPFGMLSLGALLYPYDQVSVMYWGTDDFNLGFFQPLNPTTPIAPSAAYTRAGANNVWFAGSGTVQAYDGAPPVGEVPEPAMWALMIMGLGAAGATLRRRRALTA